MRSADPFDWADIDFQRYASDLLLLFTSNFLPSPYSYLRAKSLHDLLRQQDIPTNPHLCLHHNVHDHICFFYLPFQKYT
jgi:hypothetical protein